MNEQIEALAKEAGYKHPAAVGLCEDYAYFDHKIFADLIVKECIKVVVNGGYRNPSLGEKHSLTPPEIAKMIKEHFISPNDE